jgi:ABC-type branched-subunit amino acid transport system substrate-binding protein
MNRKTVTYTSTLPNVVMEEMVEYAKKKKISKNKVIEIAVKKLLDEEIKNELRQTFKIALIDKELESMAEEGLSDYLLELKQLDK